MVKQDATKQQTADEKGLRDSDMANQDATTRSSKSKKTTFSHKSSKSHKSKMSEDGPHPTLQGFRVKPTEDGKWSVAVKYIVTKNLAITGLPAADDMADRMWNQMGLQLIVETDEEGAGKVYIGEMDVVLDSTDRANSDHPQSQANHGDQG